MTGPEAAAAELKARERLAKQALKGKTIEIVRDEDITIINQAQTEVTAPIHPTTPPKLAQKRSHGVMVDRTPPARTSTPPSNDFNIPASTAPAATGRREGRLNQVVNCQQDWRATLIPKKRGGKK
jgi:hypothetical protein